MCGECQSVSQSAVSQSVSQSVRSSESQSLSLVCLINLDIKIFYNGLFVCINVFNKYNIFFYY